MTTDAVTPLRHRMIEDMNARKHCAGTQRRHIHSCKRFAAFLNRSPGPATTEDIRRFQFHLAEAGVSICNRNRIMTGPSPTPPLHPRRARGTDGVPTPRDFVPWRFSDAGL